MNKKERIILFVNEDMTKEMETDPLTGAPNRKGFYRLASKVLAENKDRNYAVLFFDIRRFKAIGRGHLSLRFFVFNAVEHGGDKPRFPARQGKNVCNH